MFFVETEAGLMEIVRSVNRSWIYDSYFSLYRPIHPGGKCPGGIVRIPFLIITKETAADTATIEVINTRQRSLLSRTKV